MEYAIKHKEDGNKGMFFIEGEQGMLSELTYTMQDNGIMELNDTETVERMSGKGLGSRLVEYAVGYARDRNIMIDPLCSFAAAQFEKHPEYKDVRV